MSWLLRRNLSCFYCGGASSQKYTTGLESWQCRKCDSVNYLDQNGNITDPPAFDVAEEHQHSSGRPIRDGLQSFQPPEGSLFCSTCLKNQHLYHESLRSYHPPEDNDGDDKAYDAALSSYKRSLERRYPQVCLDCEPRVRAAMKEAQYLAKTDHLRRMMQASHEGRAWRSRQGTWRRMLVALGGTAWWTSLLLHALWHAAALVVVDEHNEESMDRDSSTSLQHLVPERLWSCLQSHSGSWAVEVQRPCFDIATQYVGWSLLAALLSIWWKPQLKDKVNFGKTIRLTRQTEHLQLQVVMLSVRVADWMLLRRPRASVIEPKNIQAFHIAALVFMTCTVIMSLRIVKVVPRKQKLFTDDIPMLVSGEDSVEDSGTRNPVAGIFKQSHHLNGSSSDGRFPVHKLANPMQPFAGVSSLSLPPGLDASVDGDDDSTSVSISEPPSIFSDPDNAMDWAPTKPSAWQPREPVAEHTSQAARQRAQQYQRQQQQKGRPSPFYGALPPRPQAPAARLVNPYNSVFQRSSERKKQNFFAEVMGADKASSRSDSATDSTGPGKRGGGGEGMHLAEAKWQLEDRAAAADTGLEAIFDSVFSIRDEPSEVLSQREGKQNNSRAATARGAWQLLPSLQQEQQQGRGSGERDSSWAAVVWKYLLLWGVPLLVGAVALFALSIYPDVVTALRQRTRSGEEVWNTTRDSQE